MIKGIEHVAIASTDPHKLADWYVEVLGFRINHRSNNSRTVFVKSQDGSMIEIIEAPKAANGGFEMDDAGLRHLALTVEDFQAAYDDLKKHHVKFLTDAVSKGGNSLVFFADPDGNILHLLHRETPLP